MEPELQAILQAVVDGDRDRVRNGVARILAAGGGAGEVLEAALIPAMAEIGRRFEIGEAFVPEMLVAARAMQAGLELLEPHLVAAGVQPRGRVAIGTVQGDQHDIGKNLVAIMLRGAGFQVLDLGVDVQPARFVEVVRTGGVDIVALSALLTTTMTSMPATIDALSAAGLRDAVKVLVGGAPLSAEYARSIGADGYAEDASRGVQLARALLR